MQTAGYVLAGGASSRMGTNKAFLTAGGEPLVARACAAVKEAAGSVTIVGPPELYEWLGVGVIPDGRANAGPLAGIETALQHTTADWNLVVACDLPRVTAGALRRILEEALGHPEAMAVWPESGPGHVEPLCAAYQRKALPAISRALNNGVRKVSDGLEGFPVHLMGMAGDQVFQNINTPEEWRAYREKADA